MKKLLALVVIASASTMAIAQTTAPRAGTTSNVYGELGYSSITLEDTQLPGYSSDNDTVTAFVGYQFHPNVSGELFLAGGTGTEVVNYSGVPLGSKIDSAYGLFLKPSTMLGEQFEVFGRAGFVRTDLTLSVPGGSASDSDTSFAYGAGANWHFTDRVYGQLAYTYLYDRGTTTADGYTLALGMRF